MYLVADVPADNQLLMITFIFRSTSDPEMQSEAKSLNQNKLIQRSITTSFNETVRCPLLVDATLVKMRFAFTFFFTCEFILVVLLFD